MPIKEEIFGTLADGHDILLFALTNRHGTRACITTYGGIVTQLWAKDRNGKLENIVLGFDNLDQYLGKHPHFGTIVGRYANRIKGGRFELNGKVYNLPKNNGNNTLHGGPAGFDKRVWNSIPFDEIGETGPCLQLSMTSPDMDQGFPGELAVEVTYTLSEHDELIIDYRAETTQATPVNLTNHSYFNLSGRGGDVLDHEIQVDADSYTAVDAESIPLAERASVQGTSFDVRKPVRFAEILNKLPGGIDHNFILNGHSAEKQAARISHTPSGRFVEVRTSEPGLQVFTSNFGADWSLNGIHGEYKQHCGMALEAQHFPDSPNRPDFPSTILQPGQVYRQLTVYKFGIE